MKRLLVLLLSATGIVMGQGSPAPAVSFTPATFTAVSAQSPVLDNRVKQTGGIPIISWVVTYFTDGSPTSVSIQIEGSPDSNGAPSGSWTPLTAATTPIASANPATGTSQGSIRACCDYYPWIRLNLTTFSGGTSPTLNARGNGYYAVSAVAGGGGSSGGGTIADTTNALKGDGNGNAVAVTGTGTNCVLVNGGSAACSSGTPGIVLVEEHTASSSAALQFTSCISATYDDYMIKVLNVIPATSAQRLLWQISTNGGSSYASSAYAWAEAYALTVPSGGNEGSGSDSGVQVGTAEESASASDSGISGTLWLSNPGQSAGNQQLFGQLMSKDTRDGNFDMRMLGGEWQGGPATVNAFQFIFSSGNITSGTIRCYGLTH